MDLQIVARSELGTRLLGYIRPPPPLGIFLDGAAAKAKQSWRVAPPKNLVCNACVIQIAELKINGKSKEQRSKHYSRVIFVCGDVL